MGSRCRELEQAYLSDYTLDLSISSAPFGRGVGNDGAHRDRVRHGLRDGAVRRDRLFPAAGALVRSRPHAVSALGVFTATFVYALFTLAWVDRGGSASMGETYSDPRARARRLGTDLR